MTDDFGIRCIINFYQTSEEHTLFLGICGRPLLIHMSKINNKLVCMKSGLAVQGSYLTLLSIKSLLNMYMLNTC